MTLTANGFTLDPRRRLLVRQGQSVLLPPKCRDLLVLFLENPQQPLSRREVAERLWPGETISENALTFQIAVLRKFLGAMAPLLKTIPKEGFVWEGEGAREHAPDTGPEPSATLAAVPRSPDTKKAGKITTGDILAHAKLAETPAAAAPVQLSGEATAADIDRCLEAAWEMRFHDSRQAHALCHESLRHSERLDYDRGRAFSRLYLGFCENLMSDYATARANGETALALFEKLGDRHGRAQALGNLGNTRMRQAEYGEARVLMEQALAMFRDLGDRRYEGGVLNNLGTLSLDTGDYSEALRCYLESLARARECGNLKGECSALNNLGATYDWLGDLARALEYYRQSLEKSRQSQDRQGTASALLNIGQIQVRMGDTQSAIEYTRESLQLTRLLGNRAHEAHCHLNLGEIDQREERFEAASAHFQAGLDIQREIGDHQGEAVTLQNLGDMLKRRGDLHGALDHYDRSLALAESIGYLSHASSTRIERGRLLISLQGPETALPYLRMTLAGAEAMQSRELVFRCLEALAEAHELLHEPAAALDALKRANATEKAVYSEAATTQLKQLGARHDVEKAQQEAEIFRLRNVELAQINGLLQEIDTQKSKLLTQVQRLAVEDGLTGAFNRRHLDSHLRLEFDRSRRFSRPLTVAMIDFDHFKMINDRFSHRVGDTVLKIAVELITGQIRAVDLLARYGGEEFVLVMPETPLESATTAAEKLRQTIADHDWAAIQPGLSVTVSIGLAENSSAANHEKLLAAADARLYEAKHAGRNRVAS